MDFDQPIDLASQLGEPPPVLADAYALPPPPPPEAVVPVAPPPIDPLVAAQSLPPPPPPDAHPGDPLLYQRDVNAPTPAPIAFQQLPDVRDANAPLPGPIAFQPLGAPSPIDTLPSVRDRLPSPPVDVVTAAAPLPAQAQQVRDTEQHYAATVQQYADHPFDIPDAAEQQRYLDDLATRDRAKFSDLWLQHEDARQKEVAAKRLAAANKDHDTQMANLRMRDEAQRKVMAQIDAVLAESQRLASTKIDPTGGISSGQRIAGVLASIFGGLVQGRTGSARNAGLDAFVDTVNRGIDAQKADLANQRHGLDLRRSALAEAYARTGDMFAATEAVRQASFKHAIDLIDADAQNWDSRGTMAMKRAQMKAGIQAEQAKSWLDFKYKAQEEEIKRREQLRKEQETRASILHQKAQIGLGYAQLKESQDARKEARRVKQQDKTDELAAKQAEVERKFAVGGSPRMALGSDGKPLTGPDGRPLITYDKVRAANGSVWTPPEDVHKEVIEKTAAAHSLVDVYDRILALRDRVGGESGVFNSDEYQELKGLEKEALLLKKQGTQGMSSDKDMDNLVEAAGVGDVTSFRSKAAGIKTARDRVVKQLDNTYRAAGYDGQPLQFKNPYTDAHNTSEDDRLEGLMRKPNLSFEDVVKKELADRQLAAGKENGLDITNNPDDQALYRDAYQAAQRLYDPDASPRQQREIASLSVAARGDDKAAQDARTDLQRIAAEAHTVRLRQLAKGALEEALRTRGSDEQTTMATRTTQLPAPPPPRSSGEFSMPDLPTPDALRLR